MSTETDREGTTPSAPTYIILELSEDGEMWIVTDEETGVTTQGETREHALEMLDDAVGLFKGKKGEPVTDADLRDLGIDPETVPNEPGVPDTPWFDSNEE